MVLLGEKMDMEVMAHGKRLPPVSGGDFCGRV